MKNLEAGNGSRSSQSSVSSSVRGEAETKNWVNSPINTFGSTSDSPSTGAPVTSNSQQICNCGGDTMSAAGIGDVKLDIAQFKAAPRRTTGLIYDPNKLSIPSSTVGHPAPQNESTQVTMSRSMPSSSASVKILKLVLDKFSLMHRDSQSGPDIF